MEPCRLGGSERNTGMTGKICSLTLKGVFIFKPSEVEDKAASIACRKECFIYNSLVLKSSLKKVGEWFAFCDETNTLRGK